MIPRGVFLDPILTNKPPRTILIPTEGKELLLETFTPLEARLRSANFRVTHWRAGLAAAAACPGGTRTAEAPASRRPRFPLGVGPSCSGRPGLCWTRPWRRTDLT